MPRLISHRELIELELASCIQKLAYLRGNGMTPRTFPEDERAVIEAFALACCRRVSDDLHTRQRSGTFTPDGDFEPNPLDEDEDTEPGWRTKRKREGLQ